MTLAARPSGEERPRTTASHLAPAGPPARAGGSWRELINIGTIREAARRLEAIGVRTPLQRNERLSECFRADVYLKREDLQAVRSYKIRGAYNFIAGMPGGPPPAGVVCASAGNHAQGVAWSCRTLGVRGTVFLPLRTPRQKVDRIRRIGGEMVDVRFAGATFDDALSAALGHAERTGATMVSAFDHPATISGQGTVGLEIVEQLGAPPDAIVVPVGGGGLIAGVAACLDGLAAPTRIIGAEPAGAPSMTKSVAAGHPMTIDIEDDFVDGASVRTPGKIPVAIVSELVDDVVCVPEGRVCSALLDLYQEDGIIAEPAGALSVAALDDLHAIPRTDTSTGAYTDTAAVEPEPKTVVCVLSGGNNDVTRYDEIIERSLVYRGLKHYFIVDFPNQPGSLRRFIDECLGPHDDLTLFEALKQSHREYGAVLVGIQLADRTDLEALLERMAATGLRIERLTPGSAIYRYLI